MIKFIKRILLNVLSTLISLILIPIIVLTILHFINSKSKTKISNNSILTIDLQGEIVEKPLTFFEELLAYEKTTKSKTCLLDILECIKAAKNNPQIPALYIKIGNTYIGWAQVEELKYAIQDFKKTGKLVIAYSQSYTEKTYLLATAADHILLHPAGTFSLQGISIVTIFYKNLLDKLEIKPQVFRVGTHKSAIEPFVLTSMSQESKMQLQTLVDDLYNHFLISISSYTKQPVVKLNEIAENLAISNPEKALTAQLITQIGYTIDVENLLREKLNLKQEEKLIYLDTDSYHSQLPKPTKEQKIAIIVAEGEITTGHSKKGTIGSESFTKLVRKIKADKSIKAVILRINSPGGSALASDTMWKEIKELSKIKPVVASMSNYAASGGYYIATACNKIIAYPTTITGSIGVFGLFFDTHLLLKNKLGVVTDVVKTNSHADMYTNLGRSLNDYEKNIVQSQVEEIYKTFIQKVLESRNIMPKDIENIASGRVWSGNLAHTHKLVDDLGTLDLAITTVAKLANLELETYDITYYPQKAHSIWEETFSDTKDILHLIQNYNNKEAMLIEFYNHYLLNTQGIQMKMTTPAVGN